MMLDMLKDKKENKNKKRVNELMCNFCLREIYVNEEKYIHLEDWDRGKFVKDIWGHIKCYEIATGKTSQQAEQEIKKMMQGLQPIFNKIISSSEINNEFNNKRTKEFELV